MRVRRASAVPALPLLLGLCALAACPLAGEEVAADMKEFGAPNPEYLRDKAELENMLKQGVDRPRDVELFEIGFEPLEMDRVVIPDRVGREQVFNYLTFRIRNQITDSTTQLQLKAKGYNEVLKAITEQYESAKVNQDGGVRLQVEGAGGAVSDGVILERQEARPRTRTVSLSALAHDEHGTRMGLLDDPVASGAQYRYNFPDLGSPNRATVIAKVKEKVEEKVQRKLLTVDEIRKLKLEPFDGVKRIDVPDIEDPRHDMHGWFVGEAYGVLLFNRLSDYGQRITIEVHGLTNKFRVRAPEAEKGAIENYLETRVLRRTYVLHYAYPGDEYYRDRDRSTLAKGGWEWVATHQRLAQRRSAAYARYFLGNIADEKGERRADFEAKEFWPYYNEVRGQYSKQADDGYTKPDRVPDLEKSLKDR